MTFWSLNKEGYSHYEMRQWIEDRNIWMPFSSKPSIQECFNSQEFVNLLKKAPLFDFGNICIIFGPSNMLEFKFVKENNYIFFDNGILQKGASEYDYLRLLIKFEFPKIIFEPPIGISPMDDTSWSICAIDEYMQSVCDKLNQNLKWVCLEKSCQERISWHTLELCDIHFITKYENDIHNSNHRMALIKREAHGGIIPRTIWKPLYYFSTQQDFYDDYEHKWCVIWDKRLGLKRWHCLEWSEVSNYFDSFIIIDILWSMKQRF